MDIHTAPARRRLAFMQLAHRAMKRILIGILVVFGPSMACRTTPSAPPADTTRCPSEPSPSPQARVVVEPQPTTTAAVPGDLSRVLEGPIADLEAEIASRVVTPSPEDCGPPSEAVPRGEVRETVSMELPGPALEARLMRYPGDMACAPIEYCALAIRTASGWWVSPHDDNTWCQGVTGPSSRVVMEDEDVAAHEAGPHLVVYSGLRVLGSLNYGSFERDRTEEWTETRVPFARLCEVTSDDRVHCQVEVSPPVW